MKGFRDWLESIDGRGVVLVASGAYNPIHRGHVQMFYRAKIFLAGLGNNVIGAYMIPRNYDYIKKKSSASGEVAPDDRHRRSMIDIALKGTFIRVLDLEVDRPNWSQQEMRSEVQKMHPNADVVFVGGDDKASCPQGQDVCLLELPAWGKVVIVNRSLSGGGASSTQVRRNLQTSGDDQRSLSPSVRDYVQKNNIWTKPARVGARGEQ